MYNGVLYDSHNEVEFRIWCDMLEKAGIITHLTYHPNSYSLIDKQSIKPPFYSSKKTLQGHSYTPDFKFKIADKKRWESLQTGIISKDDWVIIDTKGKHNRNERMFTVDIKLVLEQTGDFVNKVVPEELFKRTGVPDNKIVLRTPVKNDVRKKYVNAKIMKQEEL